MKRAEHGVIWQLMLQESYELWKVVKTKIKKMQTFSKWKFSAIQDKAFLNCAICARYYFTFSEQRWKSKFAESANRFVRRETNEHAWSIPRWEKVPATKPTRLPTTFNTSKLTHLCRYFDKNIARFPYPNNKRKHVN